MVIMKKRTFCCLLIGTFFSICLASVAQAGQTNAGICDRLNDTVGIYYVGGGPNPQIRKLHSGAQHLRWQSDNWIYFVVGENDGRPETVDHFRVMTTGVPNSSRGEIEVGLDRSPAKSPCNAGWFGFFGTYGSELHQKTTIDHYNKRLNKEYKYVDNNLNAWHFKWNVAPRAQDVLCDATARYTPAIGDDDANQQPQAPGLSPTPGLVGPAVAAVIGGKRALPADATSVRMVLVHRKEDENSCLAIKLDSGAVISQTKIHRLRFSNPNSRFSGQGTVIDWMR
jgi:hypothetical protein